MKFRAAYRCHSIPQCHRMHRANKHAKAKHVLVQFSNMAYIRNNNWKEDDILKSDLKKYVKEDLRRTEILDFMKRDFSQYAWSLSSLDRRMDILIYIILTIM